MASTLIGSWLEKHMVGATPAAIADPPPVLGTYPLRSDVRLDDGRSKEYAISPSRRFQQFAEFRTRYAMGPEYTSACFSVHIESPGAPDEPHSAIFAFAYWRMGADPGPPEFVCYSSTYQSMDGEYRHRFIRYAPFAEITEHSKAIDKLYTLVVDLVATGALRIDAEFYPHDPATIEAADDCRLPVMLLCALLALDAARHASKGLPAHALYRYKAMLSALCAMEPAIVDASKAARIEIVRGRRLLTILTRGDNDITSPECGHKLIPLYERELQRYGGVRYAAWRERAAAMAAGDLVVNGLTPGFGVFSQSQVLVGGASMFEGAAMSYRYQRSAATARLTKGIRDARSEFVGEFPSLTEAASEAGAAPPADDAAIAATLAGTRAALYAARERLVIGGEVLLLTMEHVGTTYYSHADVVRGNVTNDDPPFSDALATRDLGAKFMFELVFALHCAHERLGLMQGDFHGNNMTIYPWGLSHDISDGAWRDFYSRAPLSMFVLAATDAERSRQAAADARGPAIYGAGPDDVDTFVDPEDDEADDVAPSGPAPHAAAFMFPATGASACCIDFSRAIVAPKFRRRLEPEPPAETDAFFREQVERQIAIVAEFAPDLAARRDEMRAAATLEPANFFRALAAADLAKLGRVVAGVNRLEVAREKEAEAGRRAEAEAAAAAAAAGEAREPRPQYRRYRVADFADLGDALEAAAIAALRRDVAAAMGRRRVTFAAPAIAAEVFAAWRLDSLDRAARDAGGSRPRVPEWYEADPATWADPDAVAKLYGDAKGGGAGDQAATGGARFAVAPKPRPPPDADGNRPAPRSSLPPDNVPPPRPVFNPPVGHPAGKPFDPKADRPGVVPMAARPRPTPPISHDPATPYGPSFFAGRAPASSPLAAAVVAQDGRAAAVAESWDTRRPLRYSSTDYARYPPWAKLDAEVEGVGSLAVYYESRQILDGRPTLRPDPAAERALAADPRYAEAADDDKW